MVCFTPKVKNIAHLTEREPVQNEMQTQLTTQEGTNAVFVRTA